MKLSQLFTKTRKTVPADETARNAQLLIKAGYIHKEMAGAYGFLPLGLKVLENIKQTIREEMNSLGGQEITMTTLQRKELWEKTDRWDEQKVDVWFKTKLQNGHELGLGWSHEEPITEMMQNYIASYRDLPANVYQFQNKLRNELRSKSGIMRGREFMMKDLYSYSKSDEEHQQFYDDVTEGYLRIFERVGLGDSTFVTFASGGAFTQFSHEFQTLTDAGEDTIYLHRGKKLAINEEVLTDDVMKQLGVKRDDLEEHTAAEVGNIFSFGGKKCEELDLYFTDENGQQKPVILGSYGIGVTRLMGVIVERLADEKGLVWPENVAPFRVIISRLGEDENVIKAADNLYAKLQENGVEVLYDDRDTRAGAKFADADLLGIPHRIVISSKLVDKNQYEYKARSAEEAEITDLNGILAKLS